MPYRSSSTCPLTAAQRFRVATGSAAEPLASQTAGRAGRVAAGVGARYPMRTRAQLWGDYRQPPPKPLAQKFNNALCLKAKTNLKQRRKINENNYFPSVWMLGILPTVLSDVCSSSEQALLCAGSLTPTPQYPLSTNQPEISMQPAFPVQAASFLSGGKKIRNGKKYPPSLVFKCYDRIQSHKREKMCRMASTEHSL